MDRKKEIIFGSLIILFLISFLLFQVFFTGSDDQAVLEEIKSAIENEDLKYLSKKMLTVDGEKFTEEEIRELIEHVETDSEDIVVYDKESIDDGVEIDKSLPWYFKQEGRTKVFKDDYKLYVNNYNLGFHTDLDDFKLFIDGEDVGELNSLGNSYRVYENVKPGVYDYTIKYGIDYGEKIEGRIEAFPFNVKVYKDENLKNPDNLFIREEIDIKAIRCTVTSNVSPQEGKTVLYINDENTGKEIGEGIDLGPLFISDNYFIQAVADIEGKEYKSEKVNIFLNNKPNYHLEIKYEKDLTEEAIRNLIDGYLNSLVKSINYNIIYFGDYVDPKSPLHASQVELVSNLQAEGIQEELVSYTIDKIERIEIGAYEVRVTEVHNIIKPNGSVDEVTNSWVYYIQSYDGRPYLYDMDDAE